jgi:hypothetical protein
MAFLADLFAAFVLWLSALALSQFGVALERPPEPAKADKPVSRTPQNHVLQGRVVDMRVAASRICA